MVAMRYAACALCGEDIDGRAWHEVVGWSNRLASGASHGGSQVINRRQTGRLAHPECAKSGVPGQRPMFALPKGMR